MAERHIQSKWLEGNGTGEAERQGWCLFGQGHQKEAFSFFFPWPKWCLYCHFCWQFLSSRKKPRKGVSRKSGSVCVNSTWSFGLFLFGGWFTPLSSFCFLRVFCELSGEEGGERETLWRYKFMNDLTSLWPHQSRAPWVSMVVPWKSCVLRGSGDTVCGLWAHISGSHGKEYYTTAASVFALTPGARHDPRSSIYYGPLMVPWRNKISSFFKRNCPYFLTKHIF